MRISAAGDAGSAPIMQRPDQASSHCTAGDRPITAALQAELTKTEALAAGHRGILSVRRLFAFKFPSGYFSIKF
jgi:hypothetical protein